MDSIEYDFEVLEPEYPDALAPRDQLLVFAMGLDTVKVFAYFMLNSALAITGGTVKSAMGTVKLSVTVESPHREPSVHR